MRSFWEFCILHEHEILQEIKNAIDDPGPKTGGGRSGISKPTEVIAMRNLTTVIREIKVNGFVVGYPQNVIKAIRYVRARVNLNKQLGPVYQARFMYRESWEDTCERLKISQETYNKRLWKIVNMCEECREGLRATK